MAQTSTRTRTTATAQTETATCGQNYNRKVKGGNVKTYQCQKPKGHDGVHGRVNARREIKVPLTALASMEVVPETEYVPLVSRERDEQQRTVDAHVKSAYEAWIGAGKPAKPADSPRFRYLVPADQVDAIRVLLRRAGDFHNLRVQIASPTPHESGNTSLQYRVTDRRETPQKPSEQRQNA